MSTYLLEIKEDESLDSFVIPSMNFDKDEMDLLIFEGINSRAILSCYKGKHRPLFYLIVTSKGRKG